MKPARLLFTFLFLLAVTFCFSQKTMANVFAHNVRITQLDSEAPFDGNFQDGTGAAIRFTLSDVADTVKVMIYDSNKNLVRTITGTNFLGGDSLLAWDGKNDQGTLVGTGSYNISIYTASKGYNDYTEIYYNGDSNGLSTRGATAIKSQNVRNFGFQYGIWSGILRRYANNGEAWGDKKGDNTLTTPTTLPDRYSPEADSMGYIYFLGYTDHFLYRFNVDTLTVEIVDSTSIKNLALGIGIKGQGNNAYITLAAQSNIFGMQLNGPYHQGPIDTLVNDPTYTFWDVTMGRGQMMYATYYKADTALPGVAAFDLSKYSGTPMKLSDAVWTVIGDTGRANTITYDFASDPANDVIYFTIARRFSGDVNAKQNVYFIKDLNGARTNGIAYVDKQNNMTQSRSDVFIDAAHNIGFFENSNEENVLISPPTGYNNYLYQDKFSAIKVFSSEDIAAVKVDANGDFQPDRNGETVTVTGIVNSINFTASANRFSYFIQDQTGGINITKGGEVGPSLKIGDRVLVTGVLGFYRGTDQITVNDLTTDMTVLDSNNPINPVQLSIESYLANPEKYESMYIELKYVAKTAKSAAWPTSSSDANMEIWDGYKSLVLRIDKDAALDQNAEPKSPMNIKGIATQYTSSSTVYNDGYQISPNSYSDFTANVAAPPNPYFFFTKEFHDAAQSGPFEVTDSTEVDTIAWSPAVDLNGDPIIYQFIVNSEGKDIMKLITGNSGKDTMIILKGTDILKAMAGKDTVDVFMTVLAKSSGTAEPVVPSADTVYAKIVNGIVTGIEDHFVPNAFFVDQNYPNPFNPTTSIRFGLQKESNVDLRIYNILGQQVAILLSNTIMKSGVHTVNFNAKALASGTYIYRLQAGDNVVSKKMILMK